MSVICPTVTAFDTSEYKTQIEHIQPFAQRIHIDLMDGEFAPTVSPGLENIWWPHELQADIHLMYQRPMEQLEALIELRPHMVIIHNEADVHHMHFAAELHKHGIQTGLALLHDTPVTHAEQIMHSFDQVLIFSGDLGKHGGVADLALLAKVGQIRAHHPEVEIAWDGGISAENAKVLAEGGVQVLNVGGFIQKSHNPAEAYQQLASLVSSSIMP